MEHDKLNQDSVFHRNHSMQMQVQTSNPPSNDFHHHQHPPPDPPPPPPPLCSLPSSSTGPESEIKDGIAARKIQKAGREKLRRDRLNEHFIELENTLDPERPKNDKATILADTIRLLKDLTYEVNKLKQEYAALTEESHELTQEKNDLREEKASLKSDIENLNIQYQQGARALNPWIAMDHSVVVAPPSYPFPMPMPLPPAPIPLHPSMQPFPLFGNQNPAVIHNPCSTFAPYMTPNTLIDRQSTQQSSSLASGSHVSEKHDSHDRSSGESKTEKSADSNDITTELELKTPGSTTDQDSSARQRESKESQGKENSVTDGSSSSRCSSSRSVQDGSSNGISCSAKTDGTSG